MRRAWSVVPLSALVGACGTLLGVQSDDGTSPPARGDDASADQASGPSDGGSDAEDASADGDADPLLDDAGATDGGVLRVFVSSRTYAGNTLSGTKANVDCYELANGASLGGKWAAWLSSTSGAALTRFEKAAVGPWYLVDRTTLVASSLASLVKSPWLAHPIDRDENGEAATGAVWTGTLADGMLDVKNGNCSDWTVLSSSSRGGVGNSGYGDAQWTQFSSQGDCVDSSLRIYCFEQP